MKACQNCNKCVGSVRSRFAQILDEDRFRSIDLGFLPSDKDDMYLCDCGETYCSIACAEEAFRSHHYCLCVAKVSALSQQIADFKFYCLSIEGCGDNLLLLAQLLGVLASRCKGIYSEFEQSICELMTFTNRPFQEVARPPVGSERDSEWLEWLDGTISTAFELMAAAMGPQNVIFGTFFSRKQESFMVLSRLLALFELNNIDICIPSSLSKDIRSLSNTAEQLDAVLREKEVVMRLLWNDEARGIYEEEDELDVDDDEEMEEGESDDEDHCHDDHDENHIEELISQIRSEVSELSRAELLECEYPDFHGTGFFVSVARTNHSCDPNVVMEFENGNNVVSCRALRDINEGEELRMSYIGAPSRKSVSMRRAQLKDYLFHCTCPKCLEEDVANH